MKKTSCLLSLLLLLLCAGCASNFPDNVTTQTPRTSSHAPKHTVSTTTMPTEPTIPAQTSIPANNSVAPNMLLSEEIEALEAIYTIYENLTHSFPHNWYNATLGQKFDSLENLDVNDFFEHPGALIPQENYQLTEAEVDFLMNFPRMESCFLTETPIYRITKTDATFLLKWYFDLDLSKTNITNVYWNETDCYYFAAEAGGILGFEVLEAKYLDEDIIWFRYRDSRSPASPTCEATIRVYRERFVLLSNVEVK